MTVCGFHAASYGAEITASECISTDLSHAPGDTRAGKDRNIYEGLRSLLPESMWSLALFWVRTSAGTLRPARARRHARRDRPPTADQSRHRRLAPARERAGRAPESRPDTPRHPP